MDGFPIPVTHGARSFTPGWLADIARIGKGGNDRYFYGVRLMMVVNQHGGPRGGAGLRQRAGALGGGAALQYPGRAARSARPA
jgi:hypothetical protein